MKAVGIRVEYGEPLYEGEYRGTFTTVGDKEHAEMIRLYVEEGLSLGKIATYFSRSRTLEICSTLTRKCLQEGKNREMKESTKQLKA